MQRHSRPDPLSTVNVPRWLAVRDRSSRIVEWRILPPGTDLRAVLSAER